MNYIETSGFALALYMSVYLHLRYKIPAIVMFSLNLTLGAIKLVCTLDKQDSEIQ